MSMLSRAVSVFAVLCLGVIGFLAAPVSSAVAVPMPEPEEVVTLSATQESRLKSNLDELGITSETQASLLAKLRRGDLPDSSTDKKEVASWVEGRDGGTVTTYEYADGSRRVVGILPANSDAEFSALIESNCEEQQGAGYWNYGPCKIYIKDAISEAGFTASWIMASDPAWVPAEITRADSDYCQIIGGSCTVDLTVNRSQRPWIAQSDQPVRATLDFNASIWGGVAGVQGEFWLEVYTYGWGIDGTPEWI